jgi:histidine triad (HIT) family protein
MVDSFKRLIKPCASFVERVDMTARTDTVAHMTSCLFCRIIAGEIPSDLVFEDELTFAFRDLNPTAPTHVLVIPKRHIEHAGTVSSDHGVDVAAMFVTAQKVAVIDSISDSGYRIVFNVGKDSGNTVGHLHMHVIGGQSMGWPPFSS